MKVNKISNGFKVLKLTLELTRKIMKQNLICDDDVYSPLRESYTFCKQITRSKLRSDYK